MSEVPAVVALEVKAESSVGYPEPFKTRMGKADWRRLGDAFGLTQFGVNLETYQPGAQSALRHWHTLTDEFDKQVDLACRKLVDAVDEEKVGFFQLLAKDVNRFRRDAGIGLILQNTESIARL